MVEQGEHASTLLPKLDRGENSASHLSLNTIDPTSSVVSDKPRVPNGRVTQDEGFAIIEYKRV